MLGNKIKRVRININGRVQGVGFRPTVYRYAKNRNLTGWVSNTSSGVVIEVEGDLETIEGFINSIKAFPPPQANITSLSTSFLNVKNEKQFTILPSVTHSQPKTQVSPDIAICRDCLKELFNPNDRRYLYPFLNCTNCGPRFTIIKGIPYDRKNTTMKKFKMCPVCEDEYNDPMNRRFHAQPNACAECGPRVLLIKSKDKRVTVSDYKAIKDSVRLLKQGNIIAIKGLGGFHLACDATNENAVRRLRSRKYREDKPFAMMVKDINTIKRFCEVSLEEEKLLLSSKRPIVLLKKVQNVKCKLQSIKKISDAVAPNNKYLGFMLPYTPLHYLLFQDSLYVLVMTSGNISDEPIAYKNDEAILRLKGVADYFLTHNRDIYIHCDDSVTRIFNNKEIIIRRSRGYVPQPLKVPFSFKYDTLACGAHLKNTFCLGKDNEVFLSHHIGDLENLQTFSAFEEGIEHFKKIFKINPEVVAYDLHPEYLSTKYAKDKYRLSLTTHHFIPTQHHHAHIVSCLADNGYFGKVIGVTFDGTGFGDDGNIWGSEFLIADTVGYKRVAHLKYVPMPGGEQSIKEPWRMAVTYLYYVYGEDFLSLNIDFVKRLNKSKWQILKRMIEQRINSPLTSSMGRLFDAISSLIGIRDTINYEAQAAIDLEMRIDEVSNFRFQISNYKYAVRKKYNVFIIDPKDIVIGVVEDLKQSIPVGIISFKFHNTIAEIVVDVCRRIYMNTHIKEVALSGGVFQNMFLLDRTFNMLNNEGFKVFIHNHVPTNDGGVCLGQAVIANAKLGG